MTPFPGRWFLFHGVRVRVVGVFPSDPEWVPVQAEPGCFFLARVSELEPESGTEIALPRK